nr:putative ubiquitin carboxyl-terminal hydrolase-related protein [Tanacetum cinerariifolium]
MMMIGTADEIVKVSEKGLVFMEELSKEEQVAAVALFRPNDIKKMSKAYKGRKKDIEVKVVATRLLQHKQALALTQPEPDNAPEPSSRIGSRIDERRKNGMDLLNIIRSCVCLVVLRSPQTYARYLECFTFNENLEIVEHFPVMHYIARKDVDVYFARISFGKWFKRPYIRDRKQKVCEKQFQNGWQGFCRLLSGLIEFNPRLSLLQTKGKPLALSWGQTSRLESSVRWPEWDPCRSRIRGNHDCGRGLPSADAGCFVDGLRKRPITNPRERKPRKGQKSDQNQTKTGS